MGNETSSAGRTGAGEYLTFRLGGEDYGIPILVVQEIRGYTEPTRIANAPGFIKGVLNLRGVIVPIVDLRIKLREREVVYNDLTVTIVLNIGQQVVGIVVDSVSDVIALTGPQIKPPPDIQTDLDAGYITGIATVEQGGEHRMLILLDIGRLLSADDIQLAQQTLA